jgi:hypothetical protein
MIADSGLVRTVEVVVAPDTCDEPDTVLTGEKCDMAEPGRAGRALLVVVIALF